MAGVPYNEGRRFVLAENLAGKNFKVALLKSTYTPNVDHDVYGDISAHEIGATGYTPGGVAVAGAQIVKNDTTDEVYFEVDKEIDFGDLSGSAENNIAHVVLYCTDGATNLIYREALALAINGTNVKYVLPTGSAAEKGKVITL